MTKHEDSAPTSDQFAVLERAIADVARRARLAPADRDDFSQMVHLRFIEQQYEVFRRFRGGSSLRSYLTVVVKRVLLDYRNATFGKWRPSAAAARIGRIGIELERLMHRDGLRSAEAIEVLRSKDPSLSSNALEDILLRLPNRVPCGFRKFWPTNSGNSGQVVVLI